MTEWRITDILGEEVHLFTGTEAECKVFIASLLDQGSKAHYYAPVEGQKEQG